ncbi:MAG: alpha/beta hydrolase domain-containing protein [Candidatus Acidiferrales bacterium]
MNSSGVSANPGSGMHAEGPTVVAVPGPPALQLSGFDLAPLGIATEEFFISGAASSYKLPGPPTSDGRWNAMPAESAPYATRIVVVRPTDSGKFNGTVVVEWLNVSGGADGAADWIAVHREVLRGGYAYVCVSAQKVGVEGGPSLLAAGTPLKKADPERYGRLSHPGDAFSYDIFSQAGRTLRTAYAKVLGSLEPKRLIAIGESQSAAFLTTYVNAVDPIARIYDGFLIHSRFGNAASLENASMAEPAGQRGFVKLRPALRTPVITVIAETDLLAEGRIPGYYGARQPDTEKLRVWEVAGTAHADAYMFSVASMDSGSAALEKIAAGYEPTNQLMGTELAKPMNNAPQHHYVVEAALWNLDRWIKTGHAPSQAAPMKVKDGEKPDAPPTLMLDANGLAQGGVRTPWMDVPTARLSGVGNSGGPLGFMVGMCEPFDAATLDRLYPGGKREFLKKFEASLSSAIKAGFILDADRQEILDLAAIAYRGSH